MNFAETILRRTLKGMPVAVVLATVFAMGASAADWLESLAGYEGLVVAEDGTTRATHGFHSATH